MIDWNDEIDWEIIFLMEDMEKFDLCPICEKLKLPKPPQDEYWQVVCENCGLFKQRMPDLIKEDLPFQFDIEYWDGTNTFREEDIPRIKKLKGFL